MVLRCQLPVGTKEAVIERMVLSFVSREILVRSFAGGLEISCTSKIFSLHIHHRGRDENHQTTKPYPQISPNSDHKLCSLAQCANRAVGRMSEEESPAQRVAIGISFGNSYSSIAHTSGARIPLSLTGEKF